MAFKEGTPFSENQVVKLNGKPYFVVTPNQAGHAAAGRRWQVQRVPAQDSPPKDIAIPLNTYHEGSGFSYAGLAGVFDYCDGWCAQTPGRLTTWAQLATGASTTLAATAPKPWLIGASAGYFYMAFGRYVSKYLINLAGGTWAKVGADHDLGATNVIAGRPAAWGGKIYFPVQSSAGVTQVFAELTPGGAGADAWAAGPVGAEASVFTTWKALLVRANANNVYTCAISPLTAGNWSASSAVDNSQFPIIDLKVYDHYVMVRNTRGYWSFDENLNTIDELPDLESNVSTVTGMGMCYSNGYEIVPHVSGLVRWRPQAWQNVGPEQEHGLEGDISQGWGPTAEVTPYGQWFFTAQNDSYHGTGAILSYGPGRGSRGPLIPHCHHQCTGTFGALTILSDATDAQSVLIAAQVSTDGLTATPWAYALPRAGMTATDDPSVGKAVQLKTFYTSRHTDPSRDEQKTYRTYECWVDASPTGATTPGLQVWAAVNNGAFFQLLDATGAAMTVTSTGPQRFFFPKTSASVGNFVQLKYVVPAMPAGGVLASYGVRDGVIRASVRPLTKDAISTAFTLDSVRLSGGELDPRTVQQMEADLKALSGPNPAPVPYVGPNGETGYVTVTALKFDEVMFKEGSVPIKVATLLLEVQDYS